MNTPATQRQSTQKSEMKFPYLSKFELKLLILLDIGEKQLNNPIKRSIIDRDETCRNNPVSRTVETRNGQHAG